MPESSMCKSIACCLRLLLRGGGEIRTDPRQIIIVDPSTAVGAAVGAAVAGAVTNAVAGAVAGAVAADQTPQFHCSC